MAAGFIHPVSQIESRKLEGWGTKARAHPNVRLPGDQRREGRALDPPEARRVPPRPQVRPPRDSLGPAPRCPLCRAGPSRAHWLCRPHRLAPSRAAIGPRVSRD